MNIADVRDDIKTRLQSISGLQVYDVVPANPQVPCVVIQPISGIIHGAFERGSSDIRFGLQVLVQLSDWESAQNALDSYLTIGSTTSIVDALEDNLYGDADLTAENWDSYGHIAIGEVDYATVTIYVLALMSI